MADHDVRRSGRPGGIDAGLVPGSSHAILRYSRSAIRTGVWLSDRCGASGIKCAFITVRQITGYGLLDIQRDKEKDKSLARESGRVEARQRYYTKCFVSFLSKLRGDSSVN